MLEINDIDYAALVEQFLPVVRDRLAAKDNMGSKFCYIALEKDLVFQLVTQSEFKYYFCSF